MILMGQVENLDFFILSISRFYYDRLRQIFYL